MFILCGLTFDMRGLARLAGTSPLDGRVRRHARTPTLPWLYDTAHRRRLGVLLAAHASKDQERRCLREGTMTPSFQCTCRLVGECRTGLGLTQSLTLIHEHG